MTPLFPFYINSNIALRHAEKNNAFKQAVIDAKRFSTIRELSVSGEISRDQTLQYHAWMSTDSGFCSSAGRFWSETVELSKEQFDAYVTKEIFNRAREEIREEEDAKLLLLIETRATALREALASFDQHLGKCS